MKGLFEEEVARGYRAFGDLLNADKFGKSGIAFAVFPLANGTCRNLSIEQGRKGFVRDLVEL